MGNMCGTVSTVPDSAEFLVVSYDKGSELQEAPLCVRVCVRV